MLIFAGLVIAIISLNGHEQGEALTQVEWAQLGFAGLLILCGTLMVIFDKDD